MNWLKKGDKIKMLCDAGNLKKGESYTIDAVDRDDEDTPYYVTSHGHARWVCSDQFEPVKEFHVGSRIRLTKNRDRAKSGMTGTIAVDKDSEGDWGVKFDNKFDGGHDLDGRCERGYGHWIAPDEMELLEDTAKPEFKVGQIYRVEDCGHMLSGGIIKITETKGSVIRPIEYDVIRGASGSDKKFSEDSIFANSLTLLTGKEIGEAIRKWDDDHAKKEPEYNEVKRHAKVGDKIKAICDSEWAGRYKKGDILTVTGDDGDTMANPWKGKAVEYNHTSCIIEHDRYVVLEPRMKEVKRQAQAGEYIKITHSFMPNGYENGDILLVTDRFNTNSVRCKNTLICVCDSEYVVLEGYKPTKGNQKPQGKHSYTAEQIAEAKKLTKDMISECFDKRTNVVFYVAPNNSTVEAFLSLGTPRGDGEAKAKCSSNDEPNEWIGKCVALCKALHKPIPAFIMGD